MAGFGDERIIYRGPTGVTDQSELGNDGTYIGGLSVSANTGAGGVSAFNFDNGDSNYAINAGDRGTSFQGASGVGAIGAWIYPTERSNNFIACRYSQGSSSLREWMFRLRADKLSFLWFGTGSSTYRESLSATDVPLNQWSLVVVNYDSGLAVDSRLTMFLNGADDAASLSLSNGSPTEIPDRAMDLGVGNTVEVGLRYPFKGLIDDFRVFDRLVTLSEAAAWYTGLRGYDVSTSTRRQQRSQQLIN